MAEQSKHTYSPNLTDADVMNAVHDAKAVVKHGTAKDHLDGLHAALVVSLSITVEDAAKTPQGPSERMRTDLGASVVLWRTSRLERSQERDALDRQINAMRAKGPQTKSKGRSDSNTA